MSRILLCCAVGDALLLLLCWALPTAVLWLGSGHIMLTLWCLYKCLRRTEGGADPVMLPVGAVFGPAGMALLTWSEPYRRRFRRRRQLTARAIDVQKRSGRQDVTALERLSRILEERIRYPECDEVGSLAHMLRYGDLQSRYQALETVVTSFEPRLSALIVAALADEDQTIRALAAAAATQISSNLVKHRRELDTKLGTSFDLAHRYSLLLLLVDHGCHNRLLPQAQRARLLQEADHEAIAIEKLLDPLDPCRSEFEQLLSQLRHSPTDSRRSAATKFPVPTTGLVNGRTRNARATFA